MQMGIDSMSNPSAEGAERNTITVEANVTANERFSCIQPPVERKTKATNSEKQISVKLPFEVVTGEIPAAMRDRLARDFTEAELDQILMRCGRTMAPTNEDRPAVLFVLGPSAVGKSYITDASASQLFGGSHNAVILDGEVFRESHAGWTEVVLHGMKRHVLHQDAWTIFKDVKVEESPGGKVQPRPWPHAAQTCYRVTTAAHASGSPISLPGHSRQRVGMSTALKNRILEGAIGDRQNLIVPSCANQPERLETEMAMLERAGYEMHAVCLWAPLSETRARGEPRSVREGKRWDGKTYPLSVQTVAAIATRWVESLRTLGDASPYTSIALWDNTTFPAREVELEEFALLASMSCEEADQHAWQAKRPKASNWAQLRTSMAFSRAIKSGPRAVGTQTEGHEEAGRAGIASVGKAQLRRGRIEGAVASILVASLLWGAACVVLVVLARAR